uniref:NADP-dependent oxidoreductase domain-containing protein n=1 Tax=Lotharella globosa TaxID=91324 RepID=A0A7S4DGC4_9EUKA
MQRDEYYVVTKLASGDHGYDKALKAIEEQVKKLGLAYVDLYIIHSPKGKKILETWDALIEAKKRGLAKSIGVSNFGVDQLKGIKASGLAKHVSALIGYKQDVFVEKRCQR